MKFKSQPFEKRKAETEKVFERYPNRIPVICEKHPNARNTPDISKTKYIVPRDMTMSEFTSVIRERIALSAENAFYFTIYGNMPSSTDMMCNLYQKYGDPDGFLYINYFCENTFG